MFAYCRNNPVNHSDPNGDWVVDAVFLAVDIANFKSKPSLKNAGWVALSALCFVDASGIASSSMHIVRTASAMEKTVDAVKVASKSWKVGNDINALTKAGKVPSWTTVRQRYWKNEALNNVGNYSEKNLARMRKGLAPQRYNASSGKMESMELHHIIPQRTKAPGINNIDNLKSVWPDEHAAIDPYRNTGR